MLRFVLFLFKARSGIAASLADMSFYFRRVLFSPACKCSLPSLQPLALAASLNNDGIVALLLEHGADTDVSDICGHQFKCIRALSAVVVKG